MFQERYYQTDAVNATLNYFFDGGKGHPLVVVPTGGGKSPVLSKLCQEIITRWPAQEILVISHEKNIIKQDAAAISLVIGESNVGIFSAGAGKKQRRRVTVGSIQTLAKNPHYFRGITFIVVDECHRIPHKTSGQYRDFLSRYDCPVVGLTATHFRLGTGYLHEGDDRLFTDIAYEIDILTLVEQGYLCDMRAIPPKTILNTNGIRKQGGDYVVKALSETFDRPALTKMICADLALYKDRYKKWLIFAIDISHCENIAADLQGRGITSGVVHSKRTSAENETTLQAHKDGAIQALVSVETLTTGYDDPSIDLIGIVRPTQSPVLHIQMLGRGSRVVQTGDYRRSETAAERLAAIAGGPKPYCIVRDYAGNIGRLGPMNDVIVLDKRSKKKGAPITKTCESCGAENWGAARVCHQCGAEFTFKEKIKAKASKAEVIARKKKSIRKQREPVLSSHNVVEMRYGKYVGASRKVTLHVVYVCEDNRVFNEYKLFTPRLDGKWAQRWWKKRTIVPASDAPQTVDEAWKRALAGELITPKSITVDTSDKYPNIKEERF